MNRIPNFQINPRNYNPQQKAASEQPQEQPQSAPDTPNNTPQANPNDVLNAMALMGKNGGMTGEQARIAYLKNEIVRLIGGTFDAGKRENNFSVIKNENGVITGISYKSGNSSWTMDVKNSTMSKTVKNEAGVVTEYDEWQLGKNKVEAGASSFDGTKTLTKRILNPNGLQNPSITENGNVIFKTDEGSAILQGDKIYITKDGKVEITDENGNKEIVSQDNVKPYVVQNELRNTLMELIGATFNAEKRLDNFDFQTDEAGNVVSVMFKSGNTVFKYAPQEGQLVKTVRNNNRAITEATVWNVDTTKSPAEKTDIAARVLNPQGVTNPKINDDGALIFNGNNGGSEVRFIEGDPVYVNADGNISVTNSETQETTTVTLAEIQAEILEQEKENYSLMLMKLMGATFNLADRLDNFSFDIGDNGIINAVHYNSGKSSYVLSLGSNILLDKFEGTELLATWKVDEQSLEKTLVK